MGQINTNNYPAVDSLLDADLLIVENATHGTGTTTPKQLRENAIGTDPLQTTAQTVTGAINEIFEMATDTVVGLELGKMASFSDGVIVTDIDLHRAPVAGDRILFYHSTSVASPSSLTTYNDGVAVTTTIGDFSMTHPAGLTLMKCVALGESLRWQTVQDITSGYTAGIGISINGTTINNSAPQLGDDIAYSRIDTVTSGALGYFSADADCLVLDFRTDAEPYNGGYTLRLTTTGASFKYAVLKDKAGNDYSAEIPSGSMVLCKSNVSGTGSEADPVVVTVLEIGNTEMAHDVEVLKDICITEKAVSGNPVTVTDALPYLAESVVAEITPIQDLHGYDKPWVGGADLNKLDPTLWRDSIGVSHTYSNDTITITANGNATYQGVLVGGTSDLKFAAGTYYIKANVVSNSNTNLFARLGFRTAQNAFVSPIDIQSTGAKSAIVTLTEDCYFAIFVNGNESDRANTVVVSDIMVSAVDSPYRPYFNICPISGRTAVAVDDEGKNLYVGSPSFDGYSQISGWTKQDETYNGHDVYKRSEAWGGLYKKLSLPKGTYTFSVAVKTSDGGRVGIFIDRNYETTATVIPAKKDHIQSSTSWAKYSCTFTVTKEGSVAPRIEKESSGDIYISEYQLEVGETATAFVPYVTPSSVTVQLGQTVYGGTLNVTTGVMTVMDTIVDMGNLEWTYSSANTRFQANMPSDYKVPASSSERITGLLCSCYEPDISPIVGTHINGTISGYEGAVTIYVNDDTMNDAAAFKTARTGQKILYRLATPTTIQLTPTDLQMLKGYNRLSSDGGGDITLAYKADRLAAIEAALQ